MWYGKLEGSWGLPATIGSDRLMLTEEIYLLELNITFLMTFVSFPKGFIGCYFEPLG